eukprot:1632087-Alexandrium_andersonii.AAC.1
MACLVSASCSSWRFAALRTRSGRWPACAPAPGPAEGQESRLAGGPPRDQAVAARPEKEDA